MLVSAVSMQNNGYQMSNGLPFSNIRANDKFKDTSFNSLTPYMRRTVSQDKMPQLFDNINEWQSFCHRQILGGKLDVIA